MSFDEAIKYWRWSALHAINDRQACEFENVARELEIERNTDKRVHINKRIS